MKIKTRFMLFSLILMSFILTLGGGPLSAFAYDTKKADTKAPAAQEVRGNTYGNIVNGGSIAFNKNLMYYYNPTDKKIYMKENEYRKAINTDNPKYINYSSGYIYYANKNSSDNIFRVKEDGTGYEKLNSQKSLFLNLINDYIYYIDGVDHRIYRVNTVNKKVNCLSQDVKADEINVYNGWIYYKAYNDHMLYKAKLGSEIKESIKLTDAKACSINMYGGWVYFIDNADSKIYAMTIEGKGKVKISDVTAKKINVNAGYVYYLDPDVTINRIKIGEQGKTYYDDKDFFIQHVDNNYGIYIYEKSLYYRYEKALYKCDLDGKNKYIFAQ